MNDVFNFENRGYSLENMGIFEYVYNYKDALLYIEWIQSEKLIILGGDVYTFDNSEFKFTYDGWHYTMDINDEEMCSLDSVLVTKKYIQNYVDRNGTDFYFSFVMADEKYKKLIG